ncbi:MAG TPA: hypothetical protein VGR57_08535, partial [Ktedonobacterales bacterium]|nr:hypothetical protein [Ktedonobacterales bacterium]
MQQRPGNAEEPFELEHLWLPRPPQPLDPLHRVQQAQALIERRRDDARQREQMFDLMVRGMAQRSVTSAPTSFTESVRRSLRSTSIAPSPLPQDPAARWQLMALDVARSVRALAGRYPLSARHRRVALGGAGTMALALVVGGVGAALAPSEVFALMGVVSALLFSTIAAGHLLTAAMHAIMGTSVLAIGACLLYAAL